MKNRLWLFMLPIFIVLAGTMPALALAEGTGADEDGNALLSEVLTAAEPAVVEPAAEKSAMVTAADDENWEEVNVEYVERWWNGSKVESVTDTVSALKIEASTADWVDLEDDWYCVEGNVVMGINKTTLRINGDVHLILCDGASLTVTEGTYITEGSKLIIHGQSDGTGQLITSHHQGGNAGLGGRGDGRSGDLVIHGGTIKATGHTNGAGIGGGEGNTHGNGKITIYDGTITAQGGNSGAGIGSGEANNNDTCGKITIYGGTIKATGGGQAAGIGGGEDRSGAEIEIFGGDITAIGGDDHHETGGAGIGGGRGGVGATGTENAGKISIHGGKIYAEGGPEAAGIGAGSPGGGGSYAHHSKLNEIIITGGDITAEAYSGAAIGGSVDGTYGGKITISGGTVRAYSSGSGTAIGGGTNNNVESIEISGGTIIAEAGDSGAGVGSGINTDFAAASKVTITGGTITAKARYGAGIGSADNCNMAGTIEIGGGEITATSEDGAGIGSGRAMSGTVTIGGDARVTATSEDGAGIGSGDNGDMSGTIEICGTAYVEATSTGYGAAVGAGVKSNVSGNGTIKILDGVMVYAETKEDSNNSSSAIGHGDDAKKDGILELGDGLRVNAGQRWGWVQRMAAQDREDGCREPYVVIDPCEHDNCTYSLLEGDGREEKHHWQCINCLLEGEEDHEWNNNHVCIKCNYRENCSRVMIEFRDEISGDYARQLFPSYTDFNLPSCFFDMPDGMSFAGWKLPNGDVKQSGDEVNSGYEDLLIVAQWGNAWTDLQNKIDAAESGETIVLTEDCTVGCLNTALVVPEDKILTIDLNGYIINRNLDSAEEDGNAITNNGTLTIIDSSGNGVITGGNNAGNGGCIVNNGTLTMAGVTVSGNESGQTGGGIWSDGKLTMTDCSVIGNTAADSGGIYIGNATTATISSTEISGNSSTTRGAGGLSCRGDLTLNDSIVKENVAKTNGGGLWLEGKATVENSEISGNKATSNSGGGICVSGADGTSVTIAGCDITGNEAAEWGGGVYLYSGSSALTMCDSAVTGNVCGKNGGGIQASESVTLNIEGALTVNDNLKGADKNNVSLAENVVMHVTGSDSLAEGSMIGVTFSGENDWDSNPSVAIADKAIADFCVSDISGFYVGNDSSGRTIYAKPFDIIYDLSEQYELGVTESESERVSVAYNSVYTLPDINFKMPDGFNFTSWAVVMPNQDVKLLQPGETFVATGPGSAWVAALFSISYVDRTNGDQVKTEENYSLIDADDTKLVGNTNGSWFVVAKDTTINDRIDIDGKVNIILCDGVTLTAKNGFYTAGDDVLTIYGQTADTGKLEATGENCPGIGGANYETYGTINIHGGTIVANSTGAGSGAAGIGGGFNSTGGTINIYGGNITSTGGYIFIIIIGPGLIQGGGSGLGSGYQMSAQDATDVINIYGGQITANGGQYGGVGIGGSNESKTKITLSWAKASDFIRASYRGTVTVAEGKSFLIDGGPNILPSGVVSNSSAINGKKLMPMDDNCCIIRFERTDECTGSMEPAGVSLGSSYTLPKCEFKSKSGEAFFVWLVASSTEVKAYQEGESLKVTSDLIVTPAFGAQGGDGASEALAERAIMSMTSDTDLGGSMFGKLRMKSTKQTKSSIKLTWKKNGKAVKYVVFGNKCGKNVKPKKLATVTGGTKTIKKINGKKLKKGVYYSFIVMAVDKDGYVVSTSKRIHVATKGGAVGNHKSVKVNKKVLVKAKKLKKGKSLKLKAKAVAKSKKLKVKKHVGVRYESSNESIAKVTPKGVVKAKKKGTCYIYAYAQNGVSKKIKVVVK